MFGYAFDYGTCPDCGAVNGKDCKDRRKTSGRPDTVQANPHKRRPTLTAEMKKSQKK